ncbi:hypothetical protein [Burkholderia pseudomallei]|uniref:hypothetical protein n=1 Tax=Burkholderia pseudomallei TaxID=28450 RepID=UPI0011C4CBFC|nr:hypothetical protein [Burkholderia pseudomallei]
MQRNLNQRARVEAVGRSRDSLHRAVRLPRTRQNTTKGLDNYGPPVLRYDIFDQYVKACSPVPNRGLRCEALFGGPPDCLLIVMLRLDCLYAGRDSDPEIGDCQLDSIVVWIVLREDAADVDL